MPGKELQRCSLPVDNRSEKRYQESGARLLEG